MCYTCILKNFLGYYFLHYTYTLIFIINNYNLYLWFTSLKLILSALYTITNFSTWTVTYTYTHLCIIGWIGKENKDGLWAWLKKSAFNETY